MATISYIGHSSDYRTNRWLITCDCGRQFEPVTTMMSTQIVTCPKCRTQFAADYNATPPTVVIIN